MRYQITGKHIDIGAALQTHVETELRQAVEKYFDRSVEAVHLTGPRPAFGETNSVAEFFTRSDRLSTVASP